nr:YcgN family cysteine cluster protein [Magnetovibrio blakemorei]
MPLRPNNPQQDGAFWREKRLQDMTPVEWESLCDGCGRCCLEKLEDIDTGEISYTNVACGLLDMETCRCAHYFERKRFMPDCVALTPKNVAELRWMPSTCAYRLLAEGRPLPDWHPLVTGDANSVKAAGMSVEGRCISAIDIEDLEDHIVEWPE